MQHSFRKSHQSISADRTRPAICARSANLAGPALIRLGLVASLVAFAVAPPDRAFARPKKALGEYSQVCKDEHLRCLNQCQENYPKESDVLTCMGVCDDWLDDCDTVFPKQSVKLPESARPPAGGGVLEPDTSGPVLRVVPKVTPEGAIGQ